MASISPKTGVITSPADFNTPSCHARRRLWPLLGCLALLALAPLKPAPVHADPPGGTAGWTLTFDDEFTGTSLDPTKWDTGFSWDWSNGSVGNAPGVAPTNNYFGANGDVAGYPSSNVTVDTNGLSLRSAKEDFTDNNNQGNHLHHYTSGAVGTERTFAQIYGYFEANMTVATEQGIDSAFWLYSRDHQYGSYLPGVNELDVTEVTGGPWYNNAVDTAGNIDSTNIHDYQHDTVDAQGNPFLLFSLNPNGVPLQNQAHTYGMDWEPTFIKFYLDGNLIHTVNYTTPPNPGDQKPMYMILNQELENDALIGGNWYGDPDNMNPFLTIFAHARWVRVWTKTPETAYPSVPSFPSTLQATTTIQAANYDTGGPGIAYNQSQTGNIQQPLYYYARPDNNGAAYSYSADGSTPDGLSWTWAGQWYKYTVNVPMAGTYSLSFAVNTNTNSNSYPWGGRFHLEDWNVTTATGTTISDEFYLNSSQPEGTWVAETVTNSTPVHLTAGTHILRWVQDYKDYNDDFNLFSMTATAVSYDAPIEAPYPGPNPAAIPGTVQAANYDTGGQGIAFNQLNNGGQTGIRSDNSTAAFTDYNGTGLGWTRATQWYKYMVNVTQPGPYSVVFTLASPDGGTFHVEDWNAATGTGTDLTGPITTSAINQGWAYQTTVTASLPLTAGQHILRFVEDSGGYNFYSMTFTPVPGTLITGTEFDDGAGPWGGITANAAPAAFDGSISTFYDCNNPSGYVGIDTGTATTVSQIVYAPRAGYESRMVGGVFEGSNTSATAGYTTLARVTATPADGLNNTLAVTSTTPYRWLRYRAGNECNVAEVQFVAPPAGAPSKPTGLTAAPGSGKVTLAWTAASGATSYHVLRSTSSGYAGAQAVAVNIASTSYTDTGLTNGRAYFYQVTAVNTAGQSGPSGPASAQPVASPAPPTALKATAGAAGSKMITVSWTASSGAASYTVSRAASSGGTYTQAGTATGTSYASTGLTSGTTYYYKVSATNAGGTGRLAGPVSAKAP